MVTGQLQAFAIAVNATHIVWTALNNQAVRAMPIAGGTVVDLAMSQIDPHYLAIDNANAYFTTWQSNGQSGAVKKVAITGGATTTLSTFLVTAPAGLVVDMTNVYWDAGDVNAAPLGGGNATIVAPYAMSENAFGLALHGSNLFWVGGSGTGRDVRSVTTSGGAVVLVSDYIQGSIVGGVAVDAMNVYWSVDSTLHKTARSTGATSPLASAAQMGRGVAADAHDVYWCTNAGVLKVPLDGGPTTTIGADPCFGITVDASAVYWTTWTSVMRLVK
ncbi:MAG: hypothetical protein QM820_25695 [Minicystis sp.]